MIATTLEQSKKLAELGIDTSTADMTLEKVSHGLTQDSTWELTVGLDTAIKENLFSYRNGYVVPAWSLSALLELMPEKEEYEWSLSKGGYNGKGEYNEDYFISFETDGDDGIFHCESASNMIDAAFEMIMWLKENKYI